MSDNRNCPVSEIFTLQSQKNKPYDIDKMVGRSGNKEDKKDKKNK